MTKVKNNRKALSIAAAITLSLSGVAATRGKHISAIQCDAPGSNGLFVVKDQTTYAGAAAACAAKGGYLADLTNSNFAHAADLISTCSATGHTWIGSWNYKTGSTEAQDCLTAQATSGSAGGSIDQSCAGAQAVLCQTAGSSVPHNPNFSLSGPGLHVSVVPTPGGYGGSWYGGSSGGYSGGYSYGGGYPVGPVAPVYGGYAIPAFPQFGGYQYGGWKHHEGKHQCKAKGATTVTVTQPVNIPQPVTVTEPAKAPVTVTEPAQAPVTITEPAPINEPVTTTVTLPAQTITVTEMGIPQTITLPPVVTTITVDVPQTITVPTVVTVESPPETITEVITDRVTDLETLTELETITATAVVTETDTVHSTVTEEHTEFFTQTEVKTLPPDTVTLPPNTVTLPPDTVTLEPETVTLGPNTITLPPNTVTLPPNTVTLPPDTVTLPPDTITLEASTVTLPKETELVTLPASTSVVYAVRDVTKVSTVYERLPASTVMKFLTSTVTTTHVAFRFSTTSVTTTVFQPPVTVTETVGQECAVSTGDSSSSDEWIFPFEIQNFEGPGLYTIGNGGVLEVYPGGTYTFLSGGPPGGGPLSGSMLGGGGGSGGMSSSGSNVGFVFNFDFPEFTGPGLYTRTNGVLSVMNDGSYTWLSGGPAEGAQQGVSFSFPFNVPGFRGNPGVFTLDNGAVITVKSDGTYTLLSGSYPASSNSAQFSGGGMSFAFPFNVPGFKGLPGQFTLDNGAVITILRDGSYTILSGTAPNGAPNVGSGYTGGYSFNLPFHVPDFQGPGQYTMPNGAVFTLNPTGFYSFISGAPPTGVPPTGNASITSGGGAAAGTSGGVRFSFPFNVPGFTGQPGVFTLSNNAVITVKSDGSYTFLSGSAPSAGGSFSFNNIPNFTGAGLYTIAPGTVISRDAQGQISFVQGAPAGFSGGISLGGSGGISLGGSTGGISLGGSSSGGISLGGSTGTGSTGFSFSSGGSTGGSGFTPGVYTLSNNAVISVRADGSYTYLPGASDMKNAAPADAGFNAFAFPAFARRSPSTAIAN